MTISLIQGQSVNLLIPTNVVLHHFCVGPGIICDSQGHALRTRHVSYRTRRIQEHCIRTQCLSPSDEAYLEQKQREYIQHDVKLRITA